MPCNTDFKYSKDRQPLIQAVKSGITYPATVVLSRLVPKVLVVLSALIPLLASEAAGLVRFAIPRFGGPPAKVHLSKQVFDFNGGGGGGGSRPCAPLRPCVKTGFA